MCTEYSRPLVLFNSLSGKRDAFQIGRQIWLETGLEPIELQVFLRQKERALAMLQTAPLLFVLGGDGTVFGLLELLTRHNFEQQSIVVPLRAGGENVLAKALGTHKKPAATVQKILRGEFRATSLQPLTVHTQQKQENNGAGLSPVFWNIHAAFSAQTLRSVETLRDAGFGDWQRRYLALAQSLVALRKMPEVFLQLNDEPAQQVLDFGVLHAQLPYWTSKFKFSPDQRAEALLHTIIGSDLLQKEPSQFFFRLLFELAAVKLGIACKQQLLRQRSLFLGESLSLSVQDGVIAVDSELHQSHLLQCNIASSSLFSPVELARIE